MTGAEPNADAKRVAAMIRNIGRAPASVRAALELAARNWAEGVLEIVTPDGERVDIKGPQDGPHNGSFPGATWGSPRAGWPASGTRPTCRSCWRS
jgi:hypothetical protein